MKDFIIVGVDVSKRILDICFKPTGRVMQIMNNQDGFKKWQADLGDVTGQEVMVVMEHTGQYSALFESFLRNKGINYCKINALQIKRSLGMIRGKNDKVDAQRIAEYGWLRRELLRADSLPAVGIQELKQLLTLRAKLVRDRSGYLCARKELRASLSTSKNNAILKIQKEMIDVFDKQIEQVEKKMKAVIKSNEILEKTAKLLKSIKGVGDIVATYMIVCTDNFQRFINARKFNCYAGLAPFKHESGSSIKGRTRISHLANKEVKTLLNLAAFCAIRCHQEMKQYYKRRVEEGKPKMACINIVRSKLVARMFAVVKRQTPYQELAFAA